MFSATDNMDAEGDKLSIFLNSCLKKEKHVTEVRSKFEEEGIGYDTLFELDEIDLRATLTEELGIKRYRAGLIIKALRKIDGSGVQTHPAGSGASGFIVLPEQHNNYLLSLQGNEDTVKLNIEKLENAANEIQENAKTVTSEVNGQYKELSNILEQQQGATLKRVEAIKTGKLTMIQKESDVANAALQHLEISDEDFKRILNDKKLDIAKKHGAITQHIEAAKDGLTTYDMYLQKDMPLPTNTAIGYNANEKQLFEAFVQQMDDVIDGDVAFTKIEFVEQDAIIAWKSDLDTIKDATFMIQYRLLCTDKEEEEKAVDGNEWKQWQSLKAKQTKVSLNGAVEQKEDDKDDIKGNEEEEQMIEGLKGSTMYQFRIVVKILKQEICSRALSAKTPEVCGLKSTIITKMEEKKLMECIPNANRCKFTLLYRGTRDGFGAAVFHQKCDGKSATITIIRSNNQNHVFGGYTTQSWHKKGAYSHDDDAWLFALRNAKNTQRKFNISKTQSQAIYGADGYGPTFAGNHDLYVADSCNVNTSSSTNLGGSYEGCEDPYQLNGAKNFKVEEYEVWQVLDYDRNKTIHSSIINENESKQLMKWIPHSENRRFRKIFDTKVDKFAASTFHTKCDGLSPTITIAQSTTNHVFGGYVEQQWKSDNAYARDDNAWLYSLRNAKANRPRKFNVYQNQTHAMYNLNGYGPTFGNNHDLYLADSCNANSTSYTNLGGSYTGKEDPYQLTAAYNFQIKDYEVWHIFEPGTAVLESAILNQQEAEVLHQWVKASGNTHYKLLLRATVDGFAASTFHQKCDNRGKTLVIVRSETNYVFGGYTEASWKHSGDYKPDPTAWIYLLRSANGDPPEKWEPTKNNYAIYANNLYGPSFGSGHDIYLADACNANTTSYSGLGSTYSAEASQTKLAGAYNFKVTEYEVWRVC